MVTPWLTAALLLAFGQVVAGFVWPSHVLVTAIGLAGQAFIIGYYALVQARLHPDQRSLWWLLASAMLFWTLALGSIVLAGNFPAADDRRALADTILFIGRGAPLMLLLTCGIDEEAYGNARWFDVAQAVLFIAAASLLLLADPLAASSPALNAASSYTAHRLREFQIIALAILALGVAALHRNRATAPLYRPLAAMLVAAAIAGVIMTHVFVSQWGVSPGSPLLVLGAAPPLAFLVAQALTGLQPPMPYTRLAAGLGRLAPAVLPLATLVVVLAPGQHGEVFDEAIGIAAGLLFGWRMVHIQLRDRRAIAELTAAHHEATGLSMIDPLTGLGNRRRLDAALKTMMGAPSGHPIAVLMIDADWFKAYNDGLGHAAGDTALRQIGAVLAKYSPAGSAVVRLGGEEFAVVVRIADLGTAALLAESLRSAVVALAISHPRETAGNLTISIGVALTFGRDADALMAAADSALYAAKNDGRNCVRAAGDSLMA